MIADEVKRDKSNGFPVEETTGCCKFCKQLINIHIQDYRTEMDREELATELCSCQQALNYTRMKKNNERVAETLENLVSKEGELGEHIEAIARDVMNNRILKAKLEIPPRIRDEPKSTLNISTTKDGSLKINILKKITEEVEI
jgi:hypothetical protein